MTRVCSLLQDTSLYEAVVSQPPLAPESIEEAVFQLPPKETPREMTPPQEVPDPDHDAARLDSTCV